MKLYYIIERNNEEDIFFWDTDIKIVRGKLGCLAFFYRKEFAEQYKEYLQKNGKEETNLVIKSIET